MLQSKMCGDQLVIDSGTAFDADGLDHYAFTTLLSTGHRRPRSTWAYLLPTGHRHPRSTWAYLCKKVPVIASKIPGESEERIAPDIKRCRFCESKSAS